MGVTLTPINKSGTQVVTKLNNAFKISLLELIQEKRVVLDARDLIPARSAKSITGLTVGKRILEFQKLSYTGKVARTMTRGKSLPRIVFDKKTDTRKLVFLGTEVEIDRDMRDAIAGSDVLPTDLTNTAVRLILEDDNDLLMNGDTALGLQGLATVIGRKTFIVPNNKEGTASEWEHKTAIEIVSDILLSIKTHEADGKFKADTLAFHPDVYYFLESKRFGADGEGKTVLQDLKDRGYNPLKKQSLKDHNGEPAFVILENNPENFYFVEVLAPQNTDEYKEKRTDVYVYEEKITEIIAPHPEAITFVEGVI